MKILNISNISSSNAMPIKSGTLQFMQDAHKEALNGVVKAFFDNPVPDTIYILSGCVNSATLPAHNISAGVLYVNGEVFDFDGATFTLTGLNKAYARIETTQYLTNADPVQFTDGVNRNVHNIRKIVIEATTVSSSLPEFKDFIPNLKFLQKATQAEENAGTIDTKATTPLVNLVAFTKRVIGVDSVSYLASLIRNGLYNTEHFALVEELKKIKNRGYVNNINPEAGTIGDTFAVSGNVASCTLTEKADNVSVYRVVLSNSQGTSDYYVRGYVQGQNLSLMTDTSIGSFVFKPINATTFDFSFREFISYNQNLKIHFEVVNI